MDSGVYNGFPHQVTVEKVLVNETAPRAAIGPAIGPFNAHVNLAKPRAILPHFVTAAAAMFLAAGSVPPISILLITLLGGGCVAAGANILNCVLDRDIDSLMTRTRRRPLPSGLIKPRRALALAVVMVLVGISILGALVSRPAAILAATAVVYYVLAYTLWLRRRTYLSAIIGSAIGAFPPIIGWVVITDRIDLTPLLLSAIMILWTVPHFWALALFWRDDYARAGLRILPEEGVGAWISGCSFLLVAASLLLVPVAGLGPTYIATACLLGAGLLYLNMRVNGRDMRASGRKVSGPGPMADARRLYAYSILYIAVLFGAMIIDRITQSI
jgi:protoheme IX farnesyltransferase